MMRKIVVFFAAIGCFGSVSAQVFSSVEITTDAYGASMAGSTIAMDATAFSPITNMAAVSLSEFNWAASYGLTSWIGSDMLHSLAGFYKMDNRSGLGFGVRYLNRESIDVTEDGITFNTITPYDAIIDVGYSYAINDVLSIGAGARYLSARLGQSDFENAVALNAGVYYRNGAWSGAFTLDNLGSRIDGGNGTMPSKVSIGGGYRYSLTEKHSVSGALQMGYRFLADDMNHFDGSIGVEYVYDGILAVRGGFHIGDETKSIGNYGSLGVGFFWKMVVLDFSYMIADSPADNIWRISAGVRF